MHAPRLAFAQAGKRLLRLRHALQAIGIQREQVLPDKAP